MRLTHLAATYRYRKSLAVAKRESTRGEPVLDRCRYKNSSFLVAEISTPVSSRPVSIDLQKKMRVY
jgi:hypothetical protein